MKRDAAASEAHAPARLDEHALDNLRYIRRAMENAGSFTTIPGWGGAAIGATALVAALAAHRAPTRTGWLAIWVLEGALALAIAVVAMIIKARRAGLPLLTGPGRRFALGLAPALVAGAVLTPVFFGVGSQGRLAGLWLLLYGAGLTAAGTYSIRVVPVMGASFMALGVLALFSPGLPPDLWMAIGFGGLQLAFGLVIARRYGG